MIIEWFQHWEMLGTVPGWQQSFPQESPKELILLQYMAEPETHVSQVGYCG